MKLFLLSDKIRTYFIFMVGLTKLIQCSDANSLFEIIIPKPNRCWYVNSDGDELASVLIKELAHTTLIWSEYELLMQSETPKCDGYIFIRQNNEEMSNLFSHSESNLIIINANSTVDTKVILLFQGDVGINKTFIEQFTKKTKLNMIILQVPEIKIKNKSFQVHDNEVQVINGYAPISGQRIMFNSNMISVPTNQISQITLEELFNSQTWNPETRNVVLEVVYTKYPPFNNIMPDGKNNGFEHRIMKGITGDWNTDIIYINDSVVKKNYLQKINKTFEQWVTADTEKFLLDGAADAALTGACIGDLTIPEIMATSQLYETACVTLMVPKPRPVDPATYLYLSVGVNVWLIFVLSYVIVCLTLFILANQEFILGSTRSPFENFIYCVISLLGVVCGHGIFLPKVIVLKIILFTWLIGTMIVTTSYITGYSSFLTEQKYTMRIKTLEQMVSAGIQWCECDIKEANHNLRTLLEFSHRPYLRKFANNYESFPHEGWDEVERRIHLGGRAIFSRFLNERFFLDATLIHNMDFREVMEPLPECVENCMLVIPISPGTPFYHILRWRLGAARETGLISHWIDEVMRDQKLAVFDKRIRKKPPHTLSVNDIRGAFLLLLIGLSLATCSFLMELIWNHFRKELISI